MRKLEHSSKIKFFRMIPSAPRPIPADGSAAGTVPMRAYRYCEPMRLASSIGWYVFPPIDFSLIWDGVNIKWKCDGLEQWVPLDSSQFPKFSSTFDTHSPAHIQGYAPPFLASVVQPGVFQVWSGLIAKTTKDWFLCVRPPINLPKQRHATSFEGVIETDKWFGPLFTNFQIEQTNTVISFKRSEPLFMVHLVHSSSLKESKDFDFCEGLPDFTAEDWKLYQDTVVDRVGERRVPGSYAIESRRARKRDE